MCVLTYLYVHMCAEACGACKSQLAILELSVPFVRQHLMSVLRCEPLRHLSSSLSVFLYAKCTEKAPCKPLAYAP